MSAPAARGRVFYDGTLTTPRLDHPEGIAVHPDGSVWCGGENGQLFRLAPDGSRLDVVASTGGFVLGVAFGPDGALYACDLAHRAVFRAVRDPAAGRPEEGWVAERFTGGGARPFATPNFPAFGPDGTLYVSDSGSQETPGGLIYRFGSDGTGGPWYGTGTPLAFANGLAWSPDGSALFVVESFRPGVTRIPPAPDGSPGDPEDVVSLPGTVPDGIAFGPDGHLYVGCYEPSRVLRVDVGTGAVTTVLDDPTAHLLCHPTNLAFRGAELFTSNLGRWHVTVIDGLT